LCEFYWDTCLILFEHPWRLARIQELSNSTLTGTYSNSMPHDGACFV